MPKTDHRVRLTPTMVEKLRPDPADPRRQIMDAVVPGFGVRFSGETKSYILRTRYPGAASASRREIGRVGVMSLADAREKAGRWRALVAAGKDPVAEDERARAREVESNATTFGAMAARFIEEKLPTERKGADVEREIKRELLPKWTDKPITDITDSDVEILIKAKKRTGPVAARNLYALVKRMFRWALGQAEYRRIGFRSSPCATISTVNLVGEAPASRDRILSDDEIFAFWRAATRMPYPGGAVYQLLSLTGLRLREVANASRDEIDRRAGAWTIPAERMKGKNAGKKAARAHVVPITPEIARVFDSLPRFNGGQFVFTNTAGERPLWMGAKLKDDLDARMLRTLRALSLKRGEAPRKTELKPFVNHDLRRTVRSQLSRLKIAEVAREALLAHRPSGVVGVYDKHTYFDEKREALEAWHARLAEIVKSSLS